MYVSRNKKNDFVNKSVWKDMTCLRYNVKTKVCESFCSPEQQFPSLKIFKLFKNYSFLKDVWELQNNPVCKHTLVVAVERLRLLQLRDNIFKWGPWVTLLTCETVQINKHICTQLSLYHNIDIIVLFLYYLPMENLNPLT